MQDTFNQHPDDHEAKMARADLFKCAQYSFKLFKMIHEDMELEGWVQAKITKAADYIASVYHYMEYEMKVSEYGENLENADMYSESIRRVFEQKLMEAKKQAEKVKATESKCSGCGKPMPKCSCDDKLEEGFPTVADARKRHEQEKGTGKFDKKETGSGTQYTRKSSTFTDGGDDADTKKAKKKAKSVDEAAKPDFLDMDKDGNKKEPMKKAVADKKKGAVKESDDKCNHTPKGKMCPVHGLKECGGMYEAAPRGQRSQDSAIKVAQIGKSKSPGANLKQGAEDALEKGNHKKIDQIHQYATTTTPTGRAKKVSEAKPSAGLSAAKKSATVKKAKAGGDIGKPGKGFDKLAKKSGGGEKGEKIAAAAMWKNMKETVAYMAEKKAAVKDLPGNQEKIDADHDGKIEKSDLSALRAGKKKETVKESTDFSRLQELTGRLNRSETPTLVENSEVNQIRALTKRLLG